jgi:hypothetical protein
MGMLMIVPALDLDLPVAESADVTWTMKGQENNKYRVRSVAPRTIIQDKRTCAYIILIASTCTTRCTAWYVSTV